jgi:hypothetical protein
MATNVIPTPELKVNMEKRRIESSAPLTLKQRVGRALREVFEGHEEYLGVTPD